MQTRFTFLEPAYPGCPGKEAVAVLVVVVVVAVVVVVVIVVVEVVAAAAAVYHGLGDDPHCHFYWGIQAPTQNE